MPKNKVPIKPASTLVHQTMKMPNGLYRVETKHLCAHFVIHNGFLTACAPILKKNIEHWLKQGKWTST